MACAGIPILSCTAILLAAPPAVPLGVEEVDREALETLTEAVVGQVSAYRPILDPLGQLRPFLAVEGDSVRVRLGTEDPWRVLKRRPGRPAVALDPLPLSSPRSRPLAGLRIVLDPGHRGGAWSEIEERHVEAGPGPPVREGTLTYSVAQHLDTQLRALGAKVLLTRGPPPKDDFPTGLLEGYRPVEEARQWLAELVHARRFRGLASYARWPLAGWFEPLIVRTLVRSAPFKLYNRFELRERSRRAADFNPHVTLSIHFNVARDPLSNGIIVFVLGNFLGQELATRSQRYYALRSLVSGEFPRATALAQTLGRAMQQELDLPALSEPSSSPLGRAKKIPVAPEDGVFARNLALVRRTPGLVLLIEGPCMNAVGEFERLQHRPRERTRAYARAVVRALVTQAELLRRR